MQFEIVQLEAWIGNNRLIFPSACLTSPNVSYEKCMIELAKARKQVTPNCSNKLLDNFTSYNCKYAYPFSSIF